MPPVTRRTRVTRQTAPTNDKHCIPWLARHSPNPQVELQLEGLSQAAYVAASLFPTSSILSDNPKHIEKEDGAIASYHLYALHFNNLPEPQPADDAVLTTLMASSRESTTSTPCG